MPEKWANQGRGSGDCRKLFANAISQFLAAAQRTARHPCAFGVAPHQLVRIQIWCIAGQKMKRELALHLVHVPAHYASFVGRQSAQDQMHRFARRADTSEAWVRIIFLVMNLIALLKAFFSHQFLGRLLRSRHGAVSCSPVSIRCSAT